jgi:hypothetical protein
MTFQRQVTVRINDMYIYLVFIAGHCTMFLSNYVLFEMCSLYMQQIYSYKIILHFMDFFSIKL